MKIDILNMPDCSQWLIPMFHACTCKKMAIQREGTDPEKSQCIQAMGHQALPTVKTCRKLTVNRSHSCCSRVSI